MNDNILVEQIRNSTDRKKIFDLTKAKVQNLENEISDLEKKIQRIDNFLKVELKEYKTSFDKNKNREITSAEFEVIDQIHRHRIDSMNLKKLNYEMKKNSKKNLIQRLLCFCWILKLPYGVDKAQVEKSKTGEKAIINKKDIYNKFFEVIMSAEKQSLKKEQSFYRLQLDFNNAPDYLVFNNHEFFSETEATSKKLDDVKDQISMLKNYEAQINGKFTDFIDYHNLRIKDFTTENNKDLFNQLFLGNTENNNIKRAM